MTVEVTEVTELAGRGAYRKYSVEFIVPGWDRCSVCSTDGNTLGLTAVAGNMHVRARGVTTTALIADLHVRMTTFSPFTTCMADICGLRDAVTEVVEEHLCLK